MIKTYRSFDNPDIKQEFGTGTVLLYDSARKIYSVAVDGKSVYQCRAIHSGTTRIFKKDDRVVVLRCGTSTWLILGSYDTAPMEETNESYLQVDAIGEKEPQAFPGDVELHNNKKPFRLRSLISIFSFGDILIRSTHACYMYLNKKTNAIKIQATNLLLSCRGFKLQSRVKEYAVRTEFVSFADTRKLSDEEKERQTVLGDLTEQIDTGDKFTSPTATAGERTKYRRHVVYEIDNATDTVRFFQKIGLTALIGKFTKENAGTSHFSEKVEQEGKPVESGVCLKLGSAYTIVFNAGTNALSIASADKSIVMDNAKMEFKVGQQVMTLDASGLTTTVTNHKMTVSGTSEESVGSKTIQSASDVSLRGAQIRLN